MFLIEKIYYFEDEYESFTINVNEFVAFEDNKLITANDTDRLDENEAPISSNNKSGRATKRWKYGIFFVIWLLVAGTLLTVREKIRIEHTVAIDSTSEKSIEN